MDVTRETDDEQTKRWNGPAGCAWVEAQELVDQMYRPFERLLGDVVAGGSHRRVLDVGCGTGGTTLAAAQRLGEQGRCTGIDISEPMIAAARARVEREGTPADFICANAQVHAFEPAGFDAIISRFGVMFFDDPVRAFANLRHAATDEADLRLIAWRSAAENPFMTTAERAAAPILPSLPPRPPHGPGQFAFADDQHVSSILKESGWTGIDIQPIDITCALPEKELLPYLTRFGPVGLIFRDLDDEMRARVVDAIQPAFDSYVHGDEVRFTAACWLIAARS